jgi:uncharacterized protein YcbX
VTVLATVVELWRFPVKSMQGEPIRNGVLGPAGLAEDRRWAVRDDADGRVMTAKRCGALLDANARLIDGTTLVTLPTTEEAEAGDPHLDAALSDWLSRPVHLARAEDNGTRAFEMSLDAEHPDRDLFEWTCPEGTFLDLASAHLLTTASLAAGQALHPDGDWDIRRFRPTALLATPGDGFEEDAWVGSELRLGEARLTVDMPTIRCPIPSRSQPGLARDTGIAATLRDHHDNNLGVYATVTQAGPVAVGDGLRTA